MNRDDPAFPFELIELVQQDLAASIHTLISRQTGLGESPEELHGAVLIALIRESAVLGAFLCKRTNQSRRYWCMKHAHMFEFYLEQAAKPMIPVDQDGLDDLRC